MRGLDAEQLQTAALTPDVAVEVLSPKDRWNEVEEKIAVYLASDANLVLIVDPKSRRARSAIA